MSHSGFNMRYILKFSLCAIAACLMLASNSCKKDEAPNVETLINQFCFNGVTNDIQSVLYEYDNLNGVYTFFISPSKGIEDIEAMLNANDYIKITSSVANGEIDLTSEGNSLSYMDFSISSAESSGIEYSELSLVLDGNNLRLSLSVKKNSGDELRAEYHGTCTNVSENHITLDRAVMSFYMGKESELENYYIVLTNAGFKLDGTDYSLESEGYALQLDLYADNAGFILDLPAGEYSSSSTVSNLTYSDKFSGIIAKDAAGNVSELIPLYDKVVVETSDNSTYTISASFVQDGTTYSVSFSGELSMENADFNPSLPQIGEDLDFKGFYAEASYEGNVLENGTGLMEIVIYDENWENRISPGHGMTLVLLHDLFIDSKKCRIMPGEYTVSSSLEHSTCMTTEEVNILGLILPLGSYVMRNDGTENATYAYVAGGNITVSENGNNTVIEGTVLTPDGYTVNIYFDGPIGITDNSKDDNDGSTTLEKDLELELDYLPTAYCTPQTDIWVKGLGTIPVEDLTNVTPPAEEACGYQSIDIGMATGFYDEDVKLVEGDIIRLDLLVNPGDEGKITTGTYTVTPNRYPASFRPGTAPRGYQGMEGNLGTRYMDIANAIGSGDIDGDGVVEENVPLNIPTQAGFACLYEGTVTISKAAGGENYYTFEIDGMDVLKHKITGSWTGPVCLMGTDTPVLPSDNSFNAPMRLKSQRSLLENKLK